jgi:thymidylate synthase (FAD)
MKIQFRSDMTVELINSMASDSAVAMAARVSTISGNHDTVVDPAKDAGLINYLMRDRHGSPFEHNAFTFYVEAPIFVFREFQRHRIASYNEESGRYKQLEPMFYVPKGTRNLVQVGKPGAYTFEPGNEKQQDMIIDAAIDVSKEAYERYESLLEAGIAREVARMVLPVNIYSSMYVTMNARALMNFLSLRTSREGTHFPSYPQREIEMCAEKMEEFFAEKMPLTYEAFNKNGRVAP